MTEQHALPLLDLRMKNVEANIAEIKDANKSIAESLAALAVLASQHEDLARAVDRGFAEIRNLQIRVGETEKLTHQVKALRDEVAGIKRIGWWAISIIVLAAFSQIWQVTVAAGIQP